MYIWWIRINGAMVRYKLILLILLVYCLCGCQSAPERDYVTVIGSVNRPGRYFVKGRVPYIILLFEAHGYTPDADPSNTIVERQGRSVMLDLSIPENRPPPHLAEQFMVHPFDVITVPSKGKREKE